MLLGICIGVFLGLIIAVLLAYALFHRGQSAAYASHATNVATELAEAKLSIGRFVYLEQERQKLKENIVVNFTEQQITHLADRVSARVQTILTAANDAALAKMS